MAASTLAVRQTLAANMAPRPSKNRVAPKDFEETQGASRPVGRRCSWGLRRSSTAQTPPAASERSQPSGSFKKGVVDVTDLSSIYEYELRHRYVIDPRNSTWMKRWDILMMLALAFTALVTPFEVSFMMDGGSITPLWWINRTVDICFIIDIFLTFNLAFEERTERGSHHVFSRYRIARNYMLGWFTIVQGRASIHQGQGPQYLCLPI